MATDHNFKVKKGLDVLGGDVNLGDGFAYKIDGTTVVDSSRNLANVGSITASDTIHSKGFVNYSANQDEPYLIASTSGWTGATTNWNTYGFQHRLKTNSGGVPRVTIDVATGEAFSVNNSKETHMRGKVIVAAGTHNASSASNADALIVGSAFISSSAQLFVDGFSRFSGPLYLSKTGSVVDYIGFTYSNDRLTLTNNGNDATAAIDAPNGYYVSAQQVITASRNLTNIGTISSGAITSSGQVTGTSLQARNDSGYGTIEVGGSSGAFIDLKKPATDDYDIRIVSDAGTGGRIQSNGVFDIDAVGDITLDADGGDIHLKDNGSSMASFTTSAATFAGDLQAENATFTGTGDVTVKIIADTDNVTETDNPTLGFSQDGLTGGTQFVIGIEGNENTAFPGSKVNSPYIHANVNNSNHPLSIGNNGSLVAQFNSTSSHAALTVTKFSNITGTNGSTILNLKNYMGSSTSTGDLSQQKSFIDFQLLDSNANEVPQVRIGAEVGEGGDANDQNKEGSGAFVVYTNDADTVSGDAGASLTEKFRVAHDGTSTFTNNVVIGDKITINKSLSGDNSQLVINNTAGATLRMGITGSGANEAAHIKTNSGEALEFHIGQASNASTPDITFKADGAGIQIQGQDFVNSSRNITAGTISSGAITSTGNLTARTGTFSGQTGTALNVNSGGTNVAAKFESTDDEVWINLKDNNSGTYGALLGHGDDALFKVADNSVNVRMLLSAAGLLDTDGGYSVGGTTVINSSRNLSNIGTISSGAITATTVKETDGGDGFTEIGSGNFGYFSWGIEIANPNSGYRAIRFAGKKKYFVLEADVLGTNSANHQGFFWGNADGTAILGGSTTGYKTTHQNSTSFHIRAINSNQNQETYNPGFSPSDGAWHHQKIAATPDGYVRIWIDGDLKFEETGYIPSAEGYLGFINYAGTVRFANIRCRTINEDEAISSGAITSSGDVTLNGKLSIEHDGSNTGDTLSLFSNRFNQTTMYGFGLASGTLYYKAATRHQFYSGSNYDNASYDVQFDGSSFVIRTGNLKMGASTFVDASRNITAGTISSGAITSSGNITIAKQTPLLTIETASNSTNPELRLKSSGAFSAEGFGIYYDNNVGDAHFQTTYANNAASLKFYTATGGSPTASNLRFEIGGDGNFDFNGGNFSDVGTISSGAITSTGQVNTFYSGANNGSLAVGRDANQAIQLFVNDGDNSIIAHQDADGNGTHNFILQRDFDGTGANNFLIRKGTSTQLQIDTNANATFYGNLYVPQFIYHGGDTNTYIQFTGDRVRIAAGGTVKFDSNNTYQTTAAPNAVSITSSAIISETVEIVFGQSSTSGVSRYEIWSDGGGSDFSLIGKINAQDAASSMSFVDTTFVDTGTINYRVYAVRYGIYSTAATTSVSFSQPSLDVTNFSAIADLNNFYLQYEKPDTRFLDHIEIYVDVDASSSNLARSGASLIYSGDNSSYMYTISASDRNNFHQFWVECVGV